MRSLYAGISGLKNHQTRMDVIGNNIANVNTTGFKASNVTFQDMLSQTIQGASGASGDRGGTNPVQIGMGMGVASINTVFTDGSFQATGKQTDLAISGQGFFVLSDGANQVYTRAGGFDFDTAGNFLVPGTGYKVMGYKADNTGVIDPNQSLQNIQIPVGSSMPAKVSSKVTYVNNLMASATAIGTPAAIAAAAAALTAATTADTNAGTALAAATTAKATAITASTAATAADTAAAAASPALTPADIVAAVTAAIGVTPSDIAVANTAALAGGATAATVSLAVHNAALAAATAVTTAGTNLTTATATKATTAAGVTAATAAVTTVNNKSSDALASIGVYDSQGTAYQLDGTFEKTGDNTWSFTPASTVKNAAGTVIANVTSPAPISIEFNTDGSFKQSTTAATITMTPTNAGAVAVSITPDFSTMTQYGATTTVAATRQDGYPSGSLEKTSINASGIIVGQFSNGQILNLAQVALANFNNPSGLGKSGESLYVKTTNSGEPQVGTAGSGGRGSFNAGSLEMSNVDLAQQFSDMIVTQRGFQANSKIITTVDTMLEELVNLKR